MSLEKYLLSNHSAEGRFAVVDAKSNELVHLFQTNMIARAFSESQPGTKVVWLSKRRIADTFNNNFNS